MTAPIIVETGDCVQGANSYVSWTDFATYLDGVWGGDTLRDLAADLTVDDQSRLLTTAAMQIDCYNWCSSQLCSGLAWPRYAFDGVPDAIREAQMLIASRLLVSGRSGGVNDTQGSALVKSIKLPAGLSATFGGEGALLSLNDDGCSTSISSPDQVQQPVQSDLECLIKPYLAPKKRKLPRQRICA